MADLPAARDRSPLWAAIDLVRRRATLRRVSGRALRVAAVAAVVLLLLVVADHTWSGGVPRVLLATAGALWTTATLVACIAAIVATIRRRLSEAHLARQIERADSIPHNLLLNAVLVAHDPHAAHAVVAAQSQAAAALETAPPARRIDAAPGENPLPWLLVAAAIWCAYFAVSPKPVLPSLGRIFGAAWSAPTATRIELIRPSAAELVYAGQPLVFEVAIRGRAPDEVRFQVLDGAGPTALATIEHRLARTASSGEIDARSVTLEAHEVVGDVRYRFAAGDCTVDGVVRVLPRPALTRFEATLSPPAYLGLASTTVDAAPLTAWAGTRANLRFSANTEMRSGIVVYAGDGETRTRLTPESTAAREAGAELLLTQSGEFWVEFSDSFGTPARSARFRVIVRADEAPQVRMLAPAPSDIPADAPLDVAEVQRLAASVHDDVALAAVTLAIERDGAVVREDMLRGGGAAKRASMDVGVPTSDIELRPGQVARVWIEATDTRTLADGSPAGQTTVSPAVTLTRKTEQFPRVARKTAEAAKNRKAAEGEAVVSTAGQEAGDGKDGGGGDAGDGPAPTMRPGEASDSSTVIDAPEGMNAGELRSEPGDAASQPADPKADPEGAAAGDSNKPQDDDAKREFENQLRRFVAENGQEIEQAARELGGGSGEREDGSEPPPGTAGNDSPSARDSREPPAEPPGSQPSAPEQPSSDPAGTSAATPAAEPAGADSPSAEAEPPAASQPADGAGQPESQPPPPASPDTKPQSAGDPAKPDPQANDSPNPDPSKPGSAEPQPEQSDAQPPSKPGTQPPNTPSPSGAASQPAEEAAAAPNAPPERTGDNPDEPLGSADEGVMIPETAEGVVGPMDGPRAGDSSDANAGNEKSRAPSEVVSALDLLARAEAITDDDLAAIGWPQEKRAEFLRKLDEVREAARRAGVLGDVRRWQSRARLGELDPRLEGARDTGLATGVSDASLQSDAFSKLATPPEQRVSAALRPILSAYYQSLAQRRATQATSQPAE